MKWSPPRIEHGVWSVERWLNCRSVLLPMVFAGVCSGCSSIPVMKSAPAVELSAAALAAPPVFDIVPPVTPPTTGTASPAVAAKTPATNSLSAPLPSAPGNSSLASKSIEPAKVGSSGQPSSAQPSPNQPRTTANTSPTPLQTPKTSNGTTSNSVAASPEPVRVATQKPSGVLVSPPKSFAWEPTGKSSGGRPFQIASPGDEGYRTLVVGSVGGNDPLALDLVEQLARRLHDDSVILGGFDCTVVKTLNPDGEATRSYLNHKGQFINELFPKVGDKTSNTNIAEVDFILKQMQTLQPQRVVHIRTVKGDAGVIAASASCQTVAKEAADWLNFKLVALPNPERPEPSLERYVATTGSSDMLTFCIPEKTPRNELWDRYGDTLLNLLLRDDLATRELARKQSQQSSADRRNQAP